MKKYTERPRSLGSLHSFSSRCTRSIASSDAQGILRLMSIVFLPLLITACGGSIGSIHVENVEATIGEAESAIEQARQVNADEYAQNILNKAENRLSESQKALSEEKGWDALRYAYEAQSEAKCAETQALQVKLNEVEIDAIDKQKKAELEKLRSDLKDAQNEAKQSRVRVVELESNIRKIKSDMQREIEKADFAKQAAEINHQNAKSKVVAMRKEVQDWQSQIEELQSELKDLKSDKRRAENRAKESSQQVRQLTVKLTEAEKKAEQAKARERAKSQSYSAKIDKIAHEKTIREAEQKARKYVAQTSQRSSLTGKTSLSKSEIKQVQQIVAAWHSAWSSGNISLHLEYYTADAVTGKNSSRSGKTTREILTRAMLNSELKKEIQKSWKKTEGKVVPEKDNLIAVYQFNRPSQKSARKKSNIYDIWIREAWFHQVGTDWKVYKEYWSFYNGVPKHPTR